MLALRTIRTSLFMCACLCMCVPSIVKVGFVCNDFKELYQGTAQRYYVQDIGYFYAKFAHLFLNLSYFTAKEISLQPSREKLIQESINTQRLRIKAGPSEKRRYKKVFFHLNLSTLNQMLGIVTLVNLGHGILTMKLVG